MISLIPRRTTSSSPDNQFPTFTFRDADSYLKERLLPQLIWYSDKARRCKSWYLRMQVVTVLLAALLPVATIYTHEANGRAFWLIPTALGVFVGLIASIEGVIKLREQWRNYRSTDQALQTETALFRMSAGTYAEVRKERAARLFVERCEDIMRGENTVTLNALTTPAHVVKVQEPNADATPAPN